MTFALSAEKLNFGTRPIHTSLGKPEGMPKGTIYLIHGFLDISLGWRYQVHVFISLGYQVLMPDSFGYGNTSSPEALDEFSLKSLSDDVAAICACFSKTLAESGHRRSSMRQRKTITLSSSLEVAYAGH